MSLVCDLPYGLAVRIPGFHPGGPGSTPGMGTQYFFSFLFHFKFTKQFTFCHLFTIYLDFRVRNSNYFVFKSGQERGIAQLTDRTFRTTWN